MIEQTKIHRDRKVVGVDEGNTSVKSRATLNEKGYFCHSIICPMCGRVSEHEQVIPAISFLSTCKCSTKVKVKVIND